MFFSHWPGILIEVSHMSSGSLCTAPKASPIVTIKKEKQNERSEGLERFGVWERKGKITSNYMEVTVYFVLGLYS